MNRRTGWIALATAVVAIVAAAAFEAGRRQAGGHASSPGTATVSSAREAAAGAESGRKVLYWHDPMVPGQRFDKPGKSPFMDMNLVPVYAEDEGAAGIAIPPGTVQNLGLRTAAARRDVPAFAVEGTGTIAEDERSWHVLQSRAEGFVEKLHVRATFDPVRAGQPVATLFVPAWVPAQEEYLALRRQPGAGPLADAARERLALLSVPEALVREAEATGVPQSRYTLRAPASGIVLELGVREGAMVTPGMTLLRIADLGRVWLHAEFPEAAASLVKPGMAALVTPAAYPDQMREGRVAAVLPQLSAGTRTLRVRVELANPGLGLKPGMAANVALKPLAPEPVVLVPRESVIATGRRAVVIVRESGGRFRVAEVTVGRESGPDVEIRSGLEGGELVVVSGQFLIDSEASLKAGLARLEAPGPRDAEAPQPARHHGEGRVESVRQGEVTLAHGPIASLGWPAMTMPFTAAPGVIPQGLATGATVKFTLAEGEGGKMVLVHVEAVHVHGDRP